MINIKKFIQESWLNIIVIATILFLIIFSFYQYFRDYYFLYTPKYYEVQQKCRQTNDEQTCKIANSLSDPKDDFNKLDAITLTCEVVENNAFRFMAILSPLFIIIITINKIHNEISSGMFKNYLTRMNYKKYLKRIALNSLKASVILPLSLILIFFIACIITKFNFTADKSVYDLAIYENWKYHNFITYGIIICIIQWFMSIFYSNISLICCKKHKSKIVTIFLSYFIFFVIDIVFYVIIFAGIVNKIVGQHYNLARYFNLMGFWFFEGNTNFFAVIGLAIMLAFISFIILIGIYKNKEGLVIANEKESI